MSENRAEKKTAVLLAVVFFPLGVLLAAFLPGMVFVGPGFGGDFIDVVNATLLVEATALILSLAMFLGIKSWIRSVALRMVIVKAFIWGSLIPLFLGLAMGALTALDG